MLYTHNTQPEQPTGVTELYWIAMLARYICFGITQQASFVKSSFSTVTVHLTTVIQVRLSSYYLI